MVVVIRCEEDNAKSVKNIVENLIASINVEHGKAHISYQGSDEKIITAMEKILELTE